MVLFCAKAVAAKARRTSAIGRRRRKRLRHQKNCWAFTECCRARERFRSSVMPSPGLLGRTHQLLKLSKLILGLSQVWSIGREFHICRQLRGGAGIILFLGE